MSFIIDALKKAEAERQRQTGPTLLEVRVTQPRRRFPLWTIVIGALLAINIVVLIAFVLRRPAPPSVPPGAASAPNAPVAPVAATPVPIPAPVAAAAAPIPAPPAAAPTLAAPIAPAAPLTSDDSGSQNPADFEPALPANNADKHAEPPSLSEIGGMPDLRLDLHVYAARSADRYALINMHRVHEGDVLPEGPRVVAIDRDGVELSYRGTAFMLHPQQSRVDPGAD